MSDPSARPDPPAQDPCRFTRCALLGLGLLDFAAMGAVIAPRAVIAHLHMLLGLGTLPEGPVVGYLARSASLLYAVHGAILLFMSRNPARYLPLVRFMGWVAILHGVGMAAIDFAEPMPLWWRCTEGPGFSATGLLLLWSLPRPRASGAER